MNKTKEFFSEFSQGNGNVHLITFSRIVKGGHCSPQLMLQPVSPLEI